MKKGISLILALVMVLSILPAIALAAGQVYISVSYDGTYISDQNGGHIAHVGIPMEEIAAVDLNEYGLGEYLYDEDGDGNFETTALQLVIYAHENLYGGSWDDVSFTGSPGSSYFQGGIFGFDENLNYYRNGQYPLAGEGWGATSDQIVLEAGDYLDIASFSSWDFFQDSNYGFHFFADESGEFTHAYSAEAESPLSAKLVRSYSGMGAGATVFEEVGYEISYGAALYHPAGTAVTDDSGCAQITFPEAGTWYLWADGGYGAEYPDSVVSAPAYAKVTVSPKEEEPTPSETEPEEPEQPRQPQSVSSVLNATMAQLAATVTEPGFGTTAGEWTVLSLARGGYYTNDNAYFTDYYDRIVQTVNTTAASINMNGALHKNKSTENSRLMVALSALGKDATSVGDWDLVEAYSANGISWIKKQGLNGTIWALLALDSHNYATTDASIRQTCVDAILAARHDDGGWSLMANKAVASDPDITGMALTALYPYRNQTAVAEACSEAFACLSELQHDNGTFASDGSECAESCAWVMVACTAWGINPDTDSRFIKNDKSVVDGLLAHYLSDSSSFQHIIGAGSNAMATDQACYALVAYNRFLNGQSALFDYSDVTFEVVPPDSDEGGETEGGEGGSDAGSGDAETAEITATLGLPAEISKGSTFNGTLSINTWDNNAGYKLIDFIMSIPEGISVTGITPGERLSGGQVSYNMESDTRKLRVVYFDANAHSTLTLSGEEFPAELFTIGFAADNVSGGTQLDVAVTGMSLKLHSDSAEDNSMVIVNTETARGSIQVVQGISFSAVCLYTGDDVDLIPSDKKAVAVAVVGIANGSILKYQDGTNEISFLHSAEITAKTGIATYVALVDASIPMENFVNLGYYTLPGGNAESVTFGDSNADGVVNAQDALAVVDTWLRKGEVPEDDQILVLNVNGDSRINTFDALGIVEKFVNGGDYGVVTTAATITTNR